MRAPDLLQAQPGGADQSRFRAGLARHDDRVVGPAQDARAHRRIEPRDQRRAVGQAAAHRQDRCADGIDQHGQRAGQQVDEAGDRTLGVGIACLPGVDDGAAVQRLSAQCEVQSLQPACAADRVQAPGLAAAARQAWNGLRRRAGKLRGYGSVAPFAGEAARPADQLAANDQAAADAGTQDQAEHVGMAAAGAGLRFRKCKAVGVIDDPDRQVERVGQVGSQRAAVDAGDVGAFDAASVRIDDAGNRNGDAARRTSGVDQRAHRGRERGEVVGGRGHPLQVADPALGRRNGAFDGAAADIETGNHGREVLK